MNLSSITPLIITFNEERNLPRVLTQLHWAKRVVVIDSFSSDATLTILRGYTNVEVHQRPFDSFASQCNFGLKHIQTDWVLSLDADYVCSDALIQEFERAHEIPSVNGFRVAFKYCVDGKPLRGSLYPPRVVLYRRGAAHYEDDGHSHHVVVDGSVSSLSAFIYHDDRKSLDAWLDAQHRYAAKEVKKLSSTPRKQLSWADRLRVTGWVAPLVMPFYCLLIKGLVLDGRAGLYYSLQRTFAEVLLALRIHDADGGRAVARNKRKSAAPLSRE